MPQGVKWRSPPPVLVEDDVESWLRSLSGWLSQQEQMFGEHADGAELITGLVDPEGVVAGNVGDLYVQIAGVSSKLFQHAGAIAGTVGWTDIGSSQQPGTVIVGEWTRTGTDVSPTTGNMETRPVAAAAAATTDLLFHENDDTGTNKSGLLSLLVAEATIIGSSVVGTTVYTVSAAPSFNAGIWTVPVKDGDDPTGTGHGPAGTLITWSATQPVNADSVLYNPANAGDWPNIGSNIPAFVDEALDELGANKVQGPVPDVGTTLDGHYAGWVGEDAAEIRSMPPGSLGGPVIEWNVQVNDSLNSFPALYAGVVITGSGFTPVAWINTLDPPTGADALLSQIFIIDIPFGIGSPILVNNIEMVHRHTHRWLWDSTGQVWLYLGGVLIATDENPIDHVFSAHDNFDPYFGELGSGTLQFAQIWDLESNDQAREIAWTTPSKPAPDGGADPDFGAFMLSWDGLTDPQSGPATIVCRQELIAKTGDKWRIRFKGRCRDDKTFGGTILLTVQIRGGDPRTNLNTIINEPIVLFPAWAVFEREFEIPATGLNPEAYAIKWFINANGDSTSDQQIFFDFFEINVIDPLESEAVGYLPTTTGDWQTPPDRVSSAFDELAARIEIEEAHGHDAVDIVYGPTVPGDWNVPPTEVEGGLDELAARVTADEALLPQIALDTPYTSNEGTPIPHRPSVPTEVFQALENAILRIEDLEVWQFGSYVRAVNGAIPLSEEYTQNGDTSATITELRFGLLSVINNTVQSERSSITMLTGKQGAGLIQAGAYFELLNVADNQEHMKFFATGPAELVFGANLYVKVPVRVHPFDEAKPMSPGVEVGVVMAPGPVLDSDLLNYTQGDPNDWTVADPTLINVALDELAQRLTADEAMLPQIALDTPYTATSGGAYRPPSPPDVRTALDSAIARSGDLETYFVGFLDRIANGANPVIQDDWSKDVEDPALVTELKIAFSAKANTGAQSQRSLSAAFLTTGPGTIVRIEGGSVNDKETYYMTGDSSVVGTYVSVPVRPHPDTVGTIPALKEDCRIYIIPGTVFEAEHIEFTTGELLNQWRPGSPDQPVTSRDAIDNVLLRARDKEDEFIGQWDRILNSDAGGVDDGKPGFGQWSKNAEDPADVTEIWISPRALEVLTGSLRAQSERDITNRLDLTDNGTIIKIRGQSFAAVEWYYITGIYTDDNGGGPSPDFWYVLPVRRHPATGATPINALQPSCNIAILPGNITEAEFLTYSADDVTDWFGGVSPTHVKPALDELASRANSSVIAKSLVTGVAGVAQVGTGGWVKANLFATTAYDVNYTGGAIWNAGLQRMELVNLAAPPAGFHHEYRTLISGNLLNAVNQQKAGGVGLGVNGNPPITVGPVVQSFVGGVMSASNTFPNSVMQAGAAPFGGLVLATDFLEVYFLGVDAQVSLVADALSWFSLEVLLVHD